MILTLLFKKNYDVIGAYNCLDFLGKSKINFSYSLVFLAIYGLWLFITFAFFYSFMSGARVESGLLFWFILGYGYLVIVYGFKAIKKILAPIIKWSIQRSINKRSLAITTKTNKEREIMEANQHRKRLKEAEEMEFAKASGQSRAMLSLYEGQLKLLQDHKRRGMDIEQETFDLRKKLLELERQENSEMINDLLKTLDNI